MIEDLDGLEVPAYRWAEILLYERWHWSPDALDGMPISEREDLKKVLRALSAREAQEAARSRGK